MQADGFKVEAGAPDNAIYVAADGKVGLGTATLVSNLTVAGDLSGGSIRLEDMYESKPWTIYGGNHFAIWNDHDNVNPFYISPFAPNNSLYISTNGVGLGTDSPAAKLDVSGGLLADGFTVEASTPTNTLHVDSAGRVGIGTNAPSSKLHVAGNVYADGSLILEGFVNERSDVASKTAFAAVNGQDILDRLSSVPISTWSYKDSPDVRHIGPTAQDFRAAYGFGPDDKHLAALDTNGVALAAIQALDEQVKEKDVRIQTLQGQVDELRMQMKALKGGAVAPRAASLWSQLAPLVLGLLAWSPG